MFGKKKDKSIRVQHYEGLQDFMQDFPCTIEMKDGQFVIQRKKPETTVTLPGDRILSFTPMEEENFMVKYHNESANTTKAKGIQKYYLVVKYLSGEGLEKHLAFWGTATEYKKFIDLQREKMNSAASSYSL